MRRLASGGVSALLALSIGSHPAIAQRAADSATTAFEVNGLRVIHQRVTANELNALNPEACTWARRNAHLFPLSRAPLRRRAVEFSVGEIPNPELPHAHHGS